MERLMIMDEGCKLFQTSHLFICFSQKLDYKDKTWGLCEHSNIIFFLLT